MTTRWLSVAFILISMTNVFGAEPKDWNEACREYIFNENAMEKVPKPDSANQMPWFPYCEGYLEGLFGMAMMTGAICLPEGGIRRYQISGSVIVEFQDETDPKMREAPPLLALKAWMKAFPCKEKKER